MRQHIMIIPRTAIDILTASVQGKIKDFDGNTVTFQLLTDTFKLENNYGDDFTIEEAADLLDAYSSRTQLIFNY